MGRPIKYSQKIANRIFELLRTDTYTVTEVCRMVKIASSTFYSWRSTYLEFFEGIKQAEAERNELITTEAKRSLLRKVQGHLVKEVETITVGSGQFDLEGKEIPKIKKRIIRDRYIPPETSAVIFTLINLAPNEFRNRQNNEVTGKDGKDLFSQPTDEELAVRIAELKKLYHQIIAE